MALTFTRCKVEKKYELDDSFAQSFLEDILTNKAINSKKPLNDIPMYYEKNANKDFSESFIEEFCDWMKENKDEIDNISDVSINQKATITIHGNVEANQNSQISIIGNQTNILGGKR